MRSIHSLLRRLLPSPIPIHCGQAARLEFLHSGRAAFYIPASFDCCGCMVLPYDNSLCRVMRKDEEALKEAEFYRSVVLPL